MCSITRRQSPNIEFHLLEAICLSTCLQPPVSHNLLLNYLLCRLFFNVSYDILSNFVSLMAIEFCCFDGFEDIEQHLLW